MSLNIFITSRISGRCPKNERVCLRVSVCEHSHDWTVWCVVDVIPNEGLAGPRPPILLLVWKQQRRIFAAHTSHMLRLFSPSHSDIRTWCMQWTEWQYYILVVHFPAKIGQHVVGLVTVVFCHGCFNYLWRLMSLFDVLNGITMKWKKKVQN